MSTLTSLARTIAVEREIAQPISTVRHVHIGGRPLVFIPLALAGEANAPLAAMVGASPESPSLLVVPEPRDRDQRFAFAAEFAATVLEYVELLRGLPEGGHVRARWDADKDAFTWHARHLRDGGPPQPRRDGAVSAARRLANMERVQEMVAAQRAFDDPLIMAEHRMVGEAFAGQVVAAEPDRVDASGRRRVLRPRIAVDTEDEVLAGYGAELTSPARPNQKARVVEVIPLTLDGSRGWPPPGRSWRSAGSPQTTTSPPSAWRRTGT